MAFFKTFLLYGCVFIFYQNTTISQDTILHKITTSDTIAARPYKIIRRTYLSIIVKNEDNQFYECICDHTNNACRLVNYESRSHRYLDSETTGRDNEFLYSGLYLYLLPIDETTSSQDIAIDSNRIFKRQRSNRDSESDTDTDKESLASTEIISDLDRDSDREE